MSMKKLILSMLWDLGKFLLFVTFIVVLFHPKWYGVEIKAPAERPAPLIQTFEGVVDKEFRMITKTESIPMMIGGMIYYHSSTSSHPQYSVSVDGRRFIVGKGMFDMLLDGDRVKMTTENGSIAGIVRIPPKE